MIEFPTHAVSKELFAKLEVIAARTIAAETGHKRPMAFEDVAAVLVKRLSPAKLQQVAAQGLRDVFRSIVTNQRSRFKELVARERAKAALIINMPDLSAEAAERSRQRVGQP